MSWTDAARRAEVSDPSAIGCALLLPSPSGRGYLPTKSIRGGKATATLGRAHARDANLRGQPGALAAIDDAEKSPARYRITLATSKPVFQVSSRPGTFFSAPITA
jgi:hypothetical protein